MNCAFCENPIVKERTIIENDLASAFLTYTPIVPGHTLVAPKRHVKIYDDLTAEERVAMEDLRSRIRPALKYLFEATGFNYAWNEEEVGGQSVPHVHLHIVPRKHGDVGVHQYEPRQFLYWSGLRSKTPEEELIAVAQKIREAVNQAP